MLSSSRTQIVLHCADACAAKGIEMAPWELKQNTILGPTSLATVPPLLRVGTCEDASLHTGTISQTPLQTSPSMHAPLQHLQAFQTGHMQLLRQDIKLS